MGIGERIKELREERHLTVSELARRSGLSSPSVLAKIESEDRSPRLETLVNIARGLDVEPSTFADLVSKPAPVKKLTLDDLRYVLELLPDLEPADRAFVMEYVDAKRNSNRRRRHREASEVDLEAEAAIQVKADDPAMDRFEKPAKKKSTRKRQRK